MTSRFGFAAEFRCEDLCKLKPVESGGLSRRAARGFVSSYSELSRFNSLRMVALENGTPNKLRVFMELH